jgi:ABC-2 type transport system permease protein
MRAFQAQVMAELTMTLQRGESLLVTLGIPAFLLVFFSEVHVLPTGDSHPVDFLAPGVLALAVMSTAMVSLGIATGFERSYGVLKRLGSTPLGRPRLLAAKIVSVLAVEVVQVAVLVAIAYGLGWQPHGSAGLAIVADFQAPIAVAGLGLAMAGALRAEINLALANGVYLVLLLIGGIVFPVTKLGGFAVVARGLPTAALSRALQATLGGTGALTSVPAESWIVLVIWAVAAPAVAGLSFRWE